MRMVAVLLQAVILGAVIAQVLTKSQTKRELLEENKVCFYACLSYINLANLCLGRIDPC